MRSHEREICFSQFSPSSCYISLPESNPATRNQTIDITRDQTIAVLLAALSVFREEIDSDISAPRILTLLTVLKNPGIQQPAMSDHINGIAQSTVSRNVLDWTDLTSSRKPGPDFIAQRSDPEYRKRNVLFPTPKGLDFINRMAETVQARVKGV